jgi:archaemetzincin
VGRPLKVQIDDLAARLSRRLRVPVRLEEEPRAEPALLPDRDQGDADALLAEVEAGAKGGEVAVAVAAKDLAIPVFTFVFGRARQGGRAAVVSLARLDPAFYGLGEDRERLTQRALLEVVHELGHVGALAHCPDAACIMSFAGSVERVDVRGDDFCPPCARRLPSWIASGSRRA